MSRKSVIIVGAGIGGLCTAARLSSLGYQVSVFEKEALVGGRANRIEKDGYKFDIGPTLLMMTDVLEETFRFCGKKND
jgi:phytoene desaturase